MTLDTFIFLLFTYILERSTPRQEDLGFTEEIRPFEVHCITVLVGYAAALLGNQHPNSLK
jgi:hypothetical protein